MSVSIDLDYNSDYYRPPQKTKAQLAEERRQREAAERKKATEARANQQIRDFKSKYETYLTKFKLQNLTPQEVDALLNLKYLEHYDALVAKITSMNLTFNDLDSALLGGLAQTVRFYAERTVKVDAAIAAGVGDNQQRLDELTKLIREQQATIATLKQTILEHDPKVKEDAQRRLAQKTQEQDQGMPQHAQGGSVQEQLQAATALLALYEAEVAKIQQQNQQLQISINELLQQQTVLAQEYGSTSKTTETRRQELAALQTQHKQLKKGAQVIGVEIKGMQDSKPRLEQQLSGQREKHAQLEERVQTATADVQTLKEKLQPLEKIVADLNRRIGAETQQKQQLEQENKQLMAELETKLTDRSALTERHFTEDNKSAELLADIQRLEAENPRLAARKQELEAANRELGSGNQAAEQLIIVDVYRRQINNYITQHASRGSAGRGVSSFFAPKPLSLEDPALQRLQQGLMEAQSLADLTQCLSAFCTGRNSGPTAALADALRPILNAIQAQVADNAPKPEVFHHR